MKRSDTPEARFAARRARATTARLATRIETARAVSLDGLKVKARAILWRRNGEPLGRIGPDGQPIRPAEERSALARFSSTYANGASARTS